jgi:hypothetical protein
VRTSSGIPPDGTGGCGAPRRSLGCSPVVPPHQRTRCAMSMAEPMGGRCGVVAKPGAPRSVRPAERDVFQTIACSLRSLAITSARRCTTTGSNCSTRWNRQSSDATASSGVPAHRSRTRQGCGLTAVAMGFGMADAGRRSRECRLHSLHRVRLALQRGVDDRDTCGGWSSRFPYEPCVAAPAVDAGYPGSVEPRSDYSR